MPVKTMASPASSAAAITSSSRIEPPGWITQVAPAAAASSNPSGKGKNASDATTELMKFFQLPIAHEVMMAQTGFLTPHKGVNPQAYKDDTLRGQGEILVNASTFRFDGSDLMPGGVGAGTFWTGMVDYAGGKDAKAVAEEIQKSWDALK